MGVYVGRDLCEVIIIVRGCASTQYTKYFASSMHHDCTRIK